MGHDKGKKPRTGYPSYPTLPSNWVPPAPSSVVPSSGAQSSSSSSDSSSSDEDTRIFQLRLHVEHAFQEAVSKIVWRDLGDTDQVDPQWNFCAERGHSWKLVLQNYHLYPVFEFELPRGLAFCMDGQDSNSRPVVILVTQSSCVVLKFKKRESNFLGPMRLLADNVDWIAAVCEFKLKLGDEMTFKLVIHGNCGFIFEVSILKKE